MNQALAKIVNVLTPKRRWAQFSLGTVFVVVTVLCVWLAVVVNGAHRQRNAVAAIEKLGGAVRYDDPPFPIWLQKLVGHAFDRVIDVNLFKCPVIDDDLSCLAGLPNTRFISLTDTPVGDGAIQHLARLPLRRLYLGGTKLTDAGAKQLETLHDLEWLEVFGTNMTEAGVTELRQALPRCEVGYWPSGG